MTSIFGNFLGNASNWYKKTIIAFLIMNPIAFYINPELATWIVLAQFIFTLSMSLKCYPLLPGGLIAIEAVAIGMTTQKTIMYEIVQNIDVFLLLIFMVAAIHFMKDLLSHIFGKLITRIKSKTLLSLSFLMTSAVLSAFLDALTVMAVIISAMYSFYLLEKKHNDLGGADDKTEREEFRGFLRNILMHSGIGTALGGVATLVGEPQNLIIGHKLNWGFFDFFTNMLHISAPTLITGIVACYALEKSKAKKFGFGYQLTDNCRNILVQNEKKLTKNEKTKLISQGVIALLLATSLLFHIAPIGLLGLAAIVLLTSINGITEEHDIGKAFTEALPFTALLTIFFVIVSIIIDQKVFEGLIQYALSLGYEDQKKFFFIASGVLSAISDNVFVGSVYINEVKHAFEKNLISREALENLAIAINAGTNLFSIATPNGQAAFLFLLTSRIAPACNLSYMRMVQMALPYTIAIVPVALYVL